MGLGVYIILCNDDTFYTGVSRDVEKRFYIHCEGLDPDSYTYNRRPLKLMWANYFQSNTEAIFWEKKIKGWSHKKKEALINGRFEDLPGLSVCRNETHFSRVKKNSDPGFDSAQPDAGKTPI